MNSVKFAACGAAVVLCFAQPFASAAESGAEATRPEEIIVTAAPLGDVLQSSQVLSGAELLLKTAPTLGETLANEPGISSTYFGPAASRPVIRGLSGSRVQMLSDSIATLDVSDVSPDHGVAVEPLLADQVEIIRGPATLLYGSAAAGGVINVKDNRIPEAPAEAFGGGVEVRGDTAADERAVVGASMEASGLLPGISMGSLVKPTTSISQALQRPTRPNDRPTRRRALLPTATAKATGSRPDCPG